MWEGRYVQIGISSMHQTTTNLVRHGIVAMLELQNRHEATRLSRTVKEQFFLTHISMPDTHSGTQIKHTSKIEDNIHKEHPAMAGSFGDVTKSDTRKCHISNPPPTSFNLGLNPQEFPHLFNSNVGSRFGCSTIAQTSSSTFLFFSSFHC